MFLKQHREAADAIRAVQANLDADSDAWAYLHDALACLDPRARNEPDEAMALELIDDATKAKGTRVGPGDAAVMLRKVRAARDLNA